MCRVFDLVATVVLLVVLAPLFALITLIIKIDSPGPVFFGQERVGRDREQFRLAKFRTMRRRRGSRRTRPSCALSASGCPH